MNALEAGCIPKSAIVTARRPPQARHTETSPTMKLSLPQLPRCRAAFPQRIQMLLIAQRVHGLPEAPMHPRRQLPIRRQIFHRFLFPHRFVAFDQFQDAGIENEESAVDESALRRGLLLERDDPRILRHDAAETRRRSDAAPGGLSAVTLVKGDLRFDVDFDKA